MTNTMRGRFRMEWLLLVAGLLTVGLVIGASLYKEHADIDRRERERFSTQAQVVEKSVGGVLDVVNRALIGIRDDLPGWRAEKDGMAHASQRLRAFADAMRSVRTLQVLDSEGDVVAANRPELLGKNFSSRAYFQVPLAQPHIDRLYVSPPFQTSLGVWSMNVVRMVPGPNGEFAGIVSATLDPEELRAGLAAVLYEPDMWAALAHGDGLQILMEPDRPDQAAKNLAQPGSFFSRHMASGQTAQVLEGRVAATGENRLMALHTIRPAHVPMDKPLVAAVGRDMGALYAAWHQRAWLEGGLLVLLAGFSLPALMLSHRRRRRMEVEQERTAAALAESERFMRSLIDIIPGMVGYWDVDLRCRFSNIAYREWFGKTPEQMRGIRIVDLMGEELFRKNEPFMRAALAGERQDFERTLVKADGSTGYTWAHYIPDVANGRVIGFFVLVSDVTALKQTQLLLQESNAVLEKRSAEAASRAKSAFVANMSHEIRTPMNAVLGLLQLLQHTELDARQLDYTKKAQGAAQSLLGILNDILDFSKVEAGKMTLDSTPFRLDELLRNLSVVLSSALHNKEVEVLFQLDPGVPPALCGDGMRLQQVLLNLAGNAIKFTQRGEVIVALRVVESAAASIRIEFSVRDTGIGIPADRLTAIFEGFTQAENSTTRRYGGTGLGLAISQRLVRLMGGELAVESTPGHGSRFSFTLDFARDETLPASSHGSEPAPQPTPLRALIVDDNATARDVLTAMASSFGWQTVTASSGTAAIEQLRQDNAAGGAFDIIFMDWIMPGMDGWETIQHIRAMRTETRPPAILMVTAHGRELLAERLNGEPDLLDGFLVKPVTRSMLFDAVAQATQGASVSIDRRATQRLADRPLAGLRLLVVEDNPLNQQVAQELLTHAGAWVQVANNGRLGIDSIKATQPPFDAVLMDIQMPDMDGYTATRILRTELGVTLPIIAMTANAMPADRDACLAAGMSDHIGKPIDVAELIATLQRHCQGETMPLSESPPPATTSLSADAALPELPADFDLAAALSRIDGNRLLFASLARRFDSDQAAIVDRATQALRQGNRSDAVRELHTLKGLAATLGATALAKLAADGEARIKAGTECTEEDRLLTELREKLASVTTILHTVAATFDPPQVVPTEVMADPAHVLEHLDELETLLANRNMRALDVYATLKREASGMLGNSLAALDETIANLDFPAAREKVANLIAVLKP